MGSRWTSRSASAFWYVSQDFEGHGAQFEAEAPTREALSDWQYGLQLLTGVRAPDRTLTFRQVRKSRWYDLLWCGASQILVVSDRLVEVLGSEGAEGWKTYPVTLVDKKGTPVPGYQGLAITGTVGPIDWSRSKRVLPPPAVASGTPYWVLRGLWFDEQSWDGSDLVLPQDSGFLLVTDRVVRAMRRAKLKGIEFQPQAEFEIMEDAVKMGERRRGRQ